MTSRGSTSEASAVLMRNFPKNWTKQELPSKIEKLLSRFGKLLRVPEISERSVDGVDMTVATARFEAPEMAASAVKTLHGLDMRSESEKKKCGGKDPEERDMFWLQLEKDSSQRPRGRDRERGGASTTSKLDADRALQATPAEEGLPENMQESCILVQGFPPSWKEPHLKYLFVTFGGVSDVRLIADRALGRAALVELKDKTALLRAASQLNDTQVGDGDVIEESRISCRHIVGLAEQLEEDAAKARAQAEKTERQRQRREARKAKKEGEDAAARNKAQAQEEEDERRDDGETRKAIDIGRKDDIQDEEEPPSAQGRKGVAQDDAAERSPLDEPLQEARAPVNPINPSDSQAFAAGLAERAAVARREAQEKAEREAASRREAREERKRREAEEAAAKTQAEINQLDAWLVEERIWIRQQKAAELANKAAAPVEEAPVEEDVQEEPQRQPKERAPVAEVDLEESDEDDADAGPEEERDHSQRGRPDRDSRDRSAQRADPSPEKPPARVPGVQAKAKAKSRAKLTPAEPRASSRDQADRQVRRDTDSRERRSSGRRRQRSEGQEMARYKRRHEESEEREHGGRRRQDETSDRGVRSGRNDDARQEFDNDQAARDRDRSSRRDRRDRDRAEYASDRRQRQHHRDGRDLDERRQRSNDSREGDEEDFKRPKYDNEHYRSRKR